MLLWENQVKYFSVCVYVVSIPFLTLVTVGPHDAFGAQFPFNVVGRSCERVRFPKHKLSKRKVSCRGSESLKRVHQIAKCMIEGVIMAGTFSLELLTPL